MLIESFLILTDYSTPTCNKYSLLKMYSTASCLKEYKNLFYSKNILHWFSKSPNLQNKLQCRDAYKH